MLREKVSDLKSDALSPRGGLEPDSKNPGVPGGHQGPDPDTRFPM
jgi:hypothetical protein